jgi:hypothetical protein
MSAIATTVAGMRAKSRSNMRATRGMGFADLVDERRSNAAMQE